MNRYVVPLIPRRESLRTWHYGALNFPAGAVHASYSVVYMDGNGNIANNSAAWYGGEGGDGRWYISATALQRR